MVRQHLVNYVIVLLRNISVGYISSKHGVNCGIAFEYQCCYLNENETCRYDSVHDDSTTIETHRRSMTYCIRYRSCLEQQVSKDANKDNITKAKKRNTIVSSLRARHFQTSASRFFVIKKFPLFFSFKRVGKTIPNVTLLSSQTCVTDNMSASL